jgi:antitoxin component YwqK of YwqJK toxin-antitoxin module
VGSWKNDKQNGRGKLTKATGDIFEGNFKDGVVEGEVIIHFHDGSKFRGTYHNGKRHGAAIEEDKNGNRFEGSYKNDERDGKYVEKDKTGKVTETGTYVNGIKQRGS